MHDNAAHWKSGYMPLIIGGIGAMASGLLMPWVTVASPFAGAITRTGIQLHDGRFFALGLIVLALVARSEARTPKATTRTVLLVGLLVLATAGAVEYRDLTHMVARFNADLAQAKLGFGIFAMGLGLTFSLAGVLKRRIALQPSQEDAEQFAA
ncbi:MAG TPA: hypothetical protein VG034_25220 [Acidimicrobiia bacterium]|jgi:hypothetical protein|nr:hypothetical protein [Acidimicrobiia bacterium]